MTEETKPLVMRFTSNAYNDIINTIGRIPAESGGLLFGRLDDYVVREFVFDENAQCNMSSYTFDTDFLNPIIKQLWEEEQLACIGFIHSHPHGLRVPSIPDMRYFQEMFKYMPRLMYLVPIISTIPDGGFNLSPCILFEGDRNITIADGIGIEVVPYFSKYERIVNPKKYPALEVIEEEEFVPTYEIPRTFYEEITLYSIFIQPITDYIYELFENIWCSRPRITEWYSHSRNWCRRSLLSLRSTCSQWYRKPNCP